MLFRRKNRSADTAVKERRPESIEAESLVTGGKAFDAIDVMTGGGPADRTKVLSLYIYQVAYRFVDTGYAAAMSLFVLFVSAYAMRLGLADWSPIPRPRLLMLNTALLVGASLAMEWTVHAARRGDTGQVRRGLAASGVLLKDAKDPATGEIVTTWELAR